MRAARDSPSETRAKGQCKAPRYAHKSVQSGVVRKSSLRNGDSINIGPSRLVSRISGAGAHQRDTQPVRAAERDHRVPTPAGATGSLT
jgi:hypothetical protein